MDLTGAADNKVGGVTFKGISGGQRRRLSVASELLGEPSILFLDEPTSGLDGTSSLRLVQLLHTLAQEDGRTIVTTIHQPRAEIMQLFDSLLLLNAGQVAYFGPAAGAVPFIVRAGGAPFDADRDSPGDYIIDVVGLDTEREEGMSIDLVAFYAESEESRTMLRLVNDGVPLGEDESSATTSPGTERESAGLLSGAAQASDYQTDWHTQTWVLIGRRLKRAFAKRSAIVLEIGQVTLVSIILAAALSYRSDPTRKPYYDCLWLVCSCTYISVTQYLNGANEYMDERAILSKEFESGICRLEAYYSSFWVTEAPRAMVHTTIVFVIGYPWVVGDADNWPLVFVLLWLGAVSWQGCVALGAALTNNRKVVMSAMLLWICMGSIFGGFMIDYNNIRPIFRWCYYASPMPFTIRLLTLLQLNDNPIYDMTCIDAVQATQQNLAATPDWADVASELQNATAICTQTFETGKGNQSLSQLPNPINTGDIFLSRLKLHDYFTIFTVLVLFVFGVLGRLLAVLVFRFRVSKEHTLKRVAAHMHQGGSASEVPNESPNLQQHLTGDGMLLTTRNVAANSPVGRGEEESATRL